MKNYKVVLICVCTLVSCGAQPKHIVKDDKTIISVIIDEFSIHTPAPPPINKKDTSISNVTVDSLLALKMTVGVYPLMQSVIDEKGIKKISKKFESIIDTTQKTKVLSNVKGIKSRKGHKIKLADTIELKKSYEFKQFDMLFQFSRIWFNSEMTRAVVEVGISKSRLDGYSILICMEKAYGKWLIIESIPTTTW